MTTSQIPHDQKLQVPAHLQNRELKPYYIGASESDQLAMLKELGLTKLGDLFSHIDNSVKFQQKPNLGPGLSFEELQNHLWELAQKNRPMANFIGDGLPVYKTSSVVGPICQIRGLTTAYTPYQPERSQGTLQTLWIYQSLMAQITGFEAPNASLYDRSTCLFEAGLCAQRLVDNSRRFLVAESLYPGDIEVLNTHAQETELIIETFPLDPATGTLDLKALEKKLQTTKDICAIAFAQVNNLGNLEPVDELANLCRTYNVKSIAVVDPMHIVAGGLKPPVEWGEKGTDMVVAEGQHLAIGANFGGPGLGIFAIRYHEQDRQSIRSTAGRFIGKTKDLKGRECKALILSTREQHIRREKATSNICSNQSFVASLAGASLLARGDQGLSEARESAEKNFRLLVNKLLQIPGVELKFPRAFNLHEVTLKLAVPATQVIQAGRAKGLHLGVDISQRYPFFKGESLLLMSVTDVVTKNDLNAAEEALKAALAKSSVNRSTHGTETTQKLQEIPITFRRKKAPLIPRIQEKDLIQYYQRLGEQNLSPDQGLYPLGSCTMKYNPVINDWAASLPGFTSLHPQAPLEDVQGNLEVLWSIQEMFKKITGLQGVTTQPVAGAQGELVGIKMFQAYHRDRGEAETRNVILIPRSAHGTNPATATMAGYQTKTVDGIQMGIVTIEADANGEMNLEQIEHFIKDQGHRVAGIMVTNPNTAGIFETKFKRMAEIMHAAGGLVYMDGANMNAIAGIVNLSDLGVDAVHNNLHKTWTIPHGGGGPGDGIVAVSHRLLDFMPGFQIEKKADGSFVPVKMKKSIGSFHRHWGNFAHKVRAYTYIKALGGEGVQKMSAVATLSARYLFQKLSALYPTLPSQSQAPRMHEFIITLTAETFKKIEASGTPKANTIARMGKLFLDFGFHAPTVAFPEPYGLMIEPTETYSKAELDQFADVVHTILKLVEDHPEVLKTVPHFTPIDRVDELGANKNPQMCEVITDRLPTILLDRLPVEKLRQTTSGDLCSLILEAHKKEMTIQK